MTYQHTQVGWVILAAIVFADVLSAAVVIAAGVPWVALVVVAGTAVVFLIFGWLAVEVDATHVRLRFGIGIIRRSWELSQLKRAETVRNPWWIGWGIRFIRGRTVFNVSGFRAVEIETGAGKVYRIGTDDPTGLSEAIGSRIPR